MEELRGGDDLQVLNATSDNLCLVALMPGHIKYDILVDYSLIVCIGFAMERLDVDKPCLLLLLVVLGHDEWNRPTRGTYLADDIDPLRFTSTA
jgi:hypothetical protein